MEFYAHKREMPDGAIVTQTVREHLVGTAQRAAQCLRQVGLEHAGYLAGLLHDLGKYTEAFQQYLDEGDSTKRGSVIHTFQGCRYLMEQYHRGDIQTISCAELLAFAVGAHHGLFDCVDQMRRIGLQYRAEKQDISYEEAVAAFRQEIPTEEIETLFAAASEEINEVIGRMDRNYDSDREYAFETAATRRPSRSMHIREFGRRIWLRSGKIDWNIWKKSCRDSHAARRWKKPGMRSQISAVCSPKTSRGSIG